MKHIIVVIVLLVVTGCSVDKKESSVSDSYSYNENGCETGKHVFEASSAEEVKAQKCAALQNNKLNNYCAEYMRSQVFKQECPGMNWGALQGLRSKSFSNWERICDGIGDYEDYSISFLFPNNTGSADLWGQVKYMLNGKTVMSDDNAVMDDFTTVRAKFTIAVVNEPALMVLKFNDDWTRADAILYKQSTGAVPMFFGTYVCH